jgi:3-phenylpropionate/trans-cinnamate dioxygenase ferredoxin component
MSHPIARIPCRELPSGSMIRIDHPPFHVLVVNVGGQYFAIEDACPHSGWSLSLGKLDGHKITCPGHAWVIDLQTGRVLLPPGLDDRCVRYHVELQAEHVVVSNAEEPTP